ncbi:uncharacterized protein BJ171DRAFT_617961 [Polychytrium aggregatum]|uniref:uncharacterized protein n=1 Tax=Polychytrium aggregatum TaxID=110093 RepID=UPI0022FDE596|nr:uncharacterized protein BJ171DRAFT_617961 [Polychytrium aggregatum]KAI9204933.1 hypothetical protein BJ171DRAFT_617961 [Polychytrium aggregatum]
MTLKEETTCIATPGFAGFVPSLKYQFGLTYGNATRHILSTDPSLKQGSIQQDLQKRCQELRVTNRGGRASVSQEIPSNGMSADDDTTLWKSRGHLYATGDDRFSFPPVPGYTGYIPRSEEYFGRPYVETTKASLRDFKRMSKSKNELPGRIQAIKDEPKPSITMARQSKSKPSFAYSADCSPIDDISPYRLPQEHSQKTFISGYTGFVPRLQNHFGEPYSNSVRKAIDEFTAPSSSRDSSRSRDKGTVHTHPIPGFTGFIPGSKYGFATTFGRTTEIAYDNFNHREEKGRVEANVHPPLPSKDLSKTNPIPGYRGHIPSYIFSAERSYGVSSKECIDQFHTRPKDVGERQSLAL